MGSSTEQEASTRSVQFQRCSCHNPTPHGYFEDMSGNVVVHDPVVSKEGARQVLSRLVEGGSIAAEEAALIGNEIESSGIAEMEGASVVSAPQDLDGLLEAIFGGRRVAATPEVRPYYGPYTFSVEPERESELPIGAFVDMDGDTLVEKIRTKTQARQVLEGAIRKGLAKEEEREGLLAAIENSVLPEEETPEALAERSRFSFQTFEEDGVRTGWFLKGKKRIRSIGPQSSKRSAITSINNEHPDYGRLVTEIEASELPR